MSKKKSKGSRKTEEKPRKKKELKLQDLPAKGDVKGGPTAVEYAVRSPLSTDPKGLQGPYEG